MHLVEPIRSINKTKKYVLEDTRAFNKHTEKIKSDIPKVNFEEVLDEILKNDMK